MHKLMEYICDELEELEKKAGKGNKLSMQEIQYADTLAHMKKNLLKADEMMGEGEYSNRGGSYARGRGDNARRDSMGRYSSEGYYEGTYEGSYNDGSYARGGRGRGGNYGMGSYERGYSRADAKEELMMQLRDMERNADEESKHMIKKWIKQVEDNV